MVSARLGINVLGSVLFAQTRAHSNTLPPSSLPSKTRSKDRKALEQIKNCHDQTIFI